MTHGLDLLPQVGYRSIFLLSSSFFGVTASESPETASLLTSACSHPHRHIENAHLSLDMPSFSISPLPAPPHPQPSPSFQFSGPFLSSPLDTFLAHTPILPPTWLSPFPSPSITSCDTPWSVSLLSSCPAYTYPSPCVIIESSQRAISQVSCLWRTPILTPGLVHKDKMKLLFTMGRGSGVRVPSTVPSTLETANSPSHPHVG